MGAHNIEFILPKSKYPTETDVKRWYNEAVEQARYEDGHDAYNGTISTTKGIQFSTKRFAYENEAYDYVLNNTEKWGKVLVVTYNGGAYEHWIVGGWAAS